MSRLPGKLSPPEAEAVSACGDSNKGRTEESIWRADREPWKQSKQRIPKKHLWAWAEREDLAEAEEGVEEGRRQEKQTKIRRDLVGGARKREGSMSLLHFSNTQGGAGTRNGGPNATPWPCPSPR